MDSESFTIVIGNHATTAFSNISSHFIGLINPVKGKIVKGFGVMIQFKGEGTIVWKIKYDDGIVHPIKIKKVLYIPEAPSCLLAPQQWSQQVNKNYPKTDGTWCVTNVNHCTLYWNQKFYRRTITWDTSVNAARICSALSSNN